MTSRQPAVLRALVDANLLISYLLVPDPSRSAVAALMAEAEAKSFTLMIPIKALNEVARVASSKPWLTARISTDDIVRLSEELEFVGEFVPDLQERPPALSRDPEDDYLLAQGIYERVNVILTRDKDLLSLGEVEGVKIMDPATFLSFLRSQRK